MKKRYFVFILSLFLMIPQIFALSVSNNVGSQNEYFSLNEPQVYVKTTQNLTNFSVNYTLFSNTYVKIFNFSSCLDGFCGDFSLVDLFSSQNGSLTGSEKFIIKAGTEQKNISLDIEKPIVSFTNFVVNNTLKKAELNFSISDNSNLFRSLNLYSRENNIDSFVTNLDGKVSYDYSFVKEGNTTLVLKLIDDAGNTNEVEKTFFIGDFFEPTIDSYSFFYLNNKYKLEFTARDKELKKYEVTQGTISVVESVSGKSITKSIELPFLSGTVLLKVFDSNNNVKVLSIAIPNLISILDEKKISNEKIYSFSSDSQECTWTKFDSTNKNELFGKSSSTFSINLDVSRNKKYNLEFNCKRGSFREYFQKEFIYDIVAPSSTKLSIEKDDNGNLILSWNESIDSQSEVRYRLFRDGDKVYDSTKLRYKDKKVSYPNEYSYELEVFDEAGNKIKTNEVSAIPNKVIVSIDTNLKSSQNVTGETFNMNLKTDKNSNVEITVSNAGTIVFQQYYDGVAEVNEVLMLKEGENIVFVDIVDEFNNRFKEEYLVNSIIDKMLVLASESPLKTPSKIIEPVKKKVPIVEANTGINLWWWFIFLVLILIMFFIFVRNIKTTSKLNRDSYRKKSVSYHRKREKDIILTKSLDKIRQKKESADKIKSILFANKIKKPRERSDFEKHKLMDLGIKKRTEPIKTEHKKVDLNKRGLKEHELAPLTKSREKSVPIKKQTLKERLFGKKVEGPKDEFSAYLMKKRNEDSWDSTKKYRESYKLELEARIEEEKKEKEEEERLKLKMLNSEPLEFEQSKKIVRKTIQKSKEVEKFHKNSLDDYLHKRKKKKFYFAERFVNSDLRKRSKK